MRHYRGQSVETGEWVYGGAYLDHYIVTGGRTLWDKEGEMTTIVRVDPKTIGEFTGKYDKYSREIFEGDMVRTKKIVDKELWFDISKVWFEDGAFMVQFGNSKKQPLCNILSNKLSLGVNDNIPPSEWFKSMDIPSDEWFKAMGELLFSPKSSPSYSDSASPSYSDSASPSYLSSESASESVSPEPEDDISTSWISVEERLPDKNTRYAGKYGVGVLCFDQQECDDSGYFHPVTYSFNFEENWFLTMLIGERDVDWMPAAVTHWKELPITPNDE